MFWVLSTKILTRIYIKFFKYDWIKLVKNNKIDNIYQKREK